MRAIEVQEGGAMCVVDVADPEPGPGEVVIEVEFAGVNRADLLQRSGRYPPPPGASDILGLECAGTVVALGSAAERWAVGDRVCALLTGGGYAERVAVPHTQVLPVPPTVEGPGAAALPEVWATAHGALRGEAQLKPGERVLVHAGASGVGTAAVQLCRALGCPCFVTVGSQAKVDACVALGADGGAVRHDGPWQESVRRWAPGGVDVSLDPVGGGYLAANQRVLAVGGRLVILGIMGGQRDRLDLGRLLVKRHRIVGTVLRSRSSADRARIVAAMEHEVWPWLADGRVAPIIDRTFELARAADAHSWLESNRSVGNVVLVV